MAVLRTHSNDGTSFIANDTDNEQHFDITKGPKNSVLSLHIVYLDFTQQILVVCTGPCGESFSFIEKQEVKALLKKSLSIHQLIDKLVGDEGDVKDITQAQR